MYSLEQLKEVVKSTKGYDIANLVDADGHERFIEGDGVLETEIEGLDVVYSKWSLSGTHLLIVFAGTFASETVIPVGNPFIAKFEVPSWILDKVYPMVGKFVDYKAVPLTSSGYSTAGTLTSILRKETNELKIQVFSGTTPSGETAFRMSFDLLIDAD